jgi:hypothetical protein
VQAIECQPWSGSNSIETNSEKAKAASEGKGRIQGFGGRKKESVCSEPRPGRGRMAIENGKRRGRRSLWGRASEGSIQRMYCVANPCHCLSLYSERAAERIEECGRATLERKMHTLAASSQA